MIIKNGKADQAIEDLVWTHHAIDLVPEWELTAAAMTLWGEIADDEKWEAVTYHDWSDTCELKKEGTFLEALTALATADPGEENINQVKHLIRSNVTHYLSDQVEEHFEDLKCEKDWSDPDYNPYINEEMA